MVQVSTTSKKQRMLNNLTDAKKVSHKFWAILFCVGFITLFASDLYAQSTRRGLGRRVSQSPVMRQYLENLPQQDIDLYVGKIIRKDGDFVIVSIMSPSVVKGRIPMYYACDSQMTPTAILENINVSHRSCATFKTKSGTALVGDIVMVKYFAPEKKETKK